MKNENIKEETGIFKIRKGNQVILIQILICFCLIFILYGFNSCTKFQEPGLLFTSATNDTIPIITSISPGRAVGGVREIQIHGRNIGFYGKNRDTNWVYIGGVSSPIRPIIKNIQDTLITIYRPNVGSASGDTVTLDVINPKVVSLSGSNKYVIDLPGAALGDYGATNPFLASSVLGAMDFDKNDNMYVVFPTSSAGGLCKVNSAGIPQRQFLLTSKNPVATDFKAATELKFTDAGVVPFGIIAVNKAFFYKFPLDTNLPGGLVFTKIIPKKLTANITKFDYNDDGVMYAGGNDVGIWSISMSGGDTTATQMVTGEYAGMKLKTIHVTGGYFYAADSARILRSQIVSGQLAFGASVMFDMSSDPALATMVINSFTIDEFGNLFICLKNNAATGGLPKYSLYYKEAGNTTASPYYLDQTILPNNVENVIWGDSNFLYLISNTPLISNRVFKMVLDRNGALSKDRTF
jgi:hypothetical protein